MQPSIFACVPFGAATSCAASSQLTWASTPTGAFAQTREVLCLRAQHGQARIPNQIYPAPESAVSASLPPRGVKIQEE